MKWWNLKRKKIVRWRISELKTEKFQRLKMGSDKKKE